MAMQFISTRFLNLSSLAGVFAQEKAVLLDQARVAKSKAQTGLGGPKSSAPNPQKTCLVEVKPPEKDRNPLQYWKSQCSSFSLNGYGFLSKLAIVLSGSVVLSLASPASAAVVNTPLPANAFITFNGLDWAWASPVNNATWPLPLDFSVQGPLGWRLPTSVEMLLAPPGGSNFLFAGANVPFNGIDPVSGSTFGFTGPEYAAAASDGACAATYFQEIFRQCDFGNAPDQTLNPRPWAGQPGDFSFSEQLVVRGLVPTAVPSPLAALGVAVGLGYSRRLRARIKAAR